MVTRELGRGICSARERGTAVPSEKTRRTRSGCVRATVARTRSAQRVAIAPVCKAQDARQVCKQSIIHAPVAVRARACASWSPSALWGAPRARVWTCAVSVRQLTCSMSRRPCVRVCSCLGGLHGARLVCTSALHVLYASSAHGAGPQLVQRRQLRTERQLLQMLRHGRCGANVLNVCSPPLRSRPVSSAAAVTIAPGDSCALGRRDAGGDNEATSATATACKRALKPSRCTSGDALP